MQMDVDALTQARLLNPDVEADSPALVEEGVTYVLHDVGTALVLDNACHLHDPDVRLRGMDGPEREVLARLGKAQRSRVRRLLDALASSAGLPPGRIAAPDSRPALRER